MNEQEIYNTIYKGMEPLKQTLDCYDIEPMTGFPILRQDKRENLFNHLVKTMTQIVVHEVSKAEKEKITLTKNNMEKEVIIVHESTISSVIKDVVSFGVLSFMLYANRRWFGDYAIVSMAFILMMIMIMMGRTSRSIKHFTDKQKAREYLETL